MLRLASIRDECIKERRTQFTLGCMHLDLDRVGLGLAVSLQLTDYGAFNDIHL